MPFDLYSDYSTVPGADPKWVSFAHTFAEKLATNHLLLRFRLRQIVQLGQPSPLIDASLVSSVLAPHVNIPEVSEFWVFMYECRSCNYGGITHGERLLHKGHDLHPTKPVHRGIKRPWGFTQRKQDVRQVWLGSPERVCSRGGGYSFVLTAGPVAEPKLLGTHAEVMLLRLKKIDHEAELARVKTALPNHRVALLPAGIDAAAAAFVTAYAALDTDAFDIEDELAVEEAEQLRRANGAKAMLKRKGLPVAPEVKVEPQPLIDAPAPKV